MTEKMILHKRNLHVVLLALALFGSGFSSAICQLVWIKELQLLFGSYIVPVAIVTAIFLFGLALGSYLSGKLADRFYRPEILLTSAFFLLALYIVLLSCFFPYLRNFYYNSTVHLYDRVWLLQLFRIFFALLVLLIPTVLMGAFLPLAAKLGIDKTESIRKKTALLFGINTIGAAGGLLTGGFYILGKQGLHAAYLIAIIIYLTLGVLLTFFSILFGAQTYTVSEAQKPKEGRLWPAGLILLILFVDGFCMMGYEIGWTRLLLNFSYEKTVYFVAVVIASLIIGSGIGSLLLIIRQWKSENIRLLYAWLPVSVSLLTFAGLLIFFIFSPELVEKRVNYISWNDVLLNEYLPVLIVLIVPAIPMGMILPASAHLLTYELKSLGHKIGLIGWINTVGSVTGSLFMGLILIPALGVVRAFAFLLVFNLFSGFFLICYQRWKIVLTGWIASLFILFFLPLGKILPSLIQSYYPDDHLVAFHEGPSATVTVHRIPSGVEALSINGDKTAFTSVEDLRVHRTLAALPMIYCPRFDNALVIGFGLGVTTGFLAEKNDALITVVDLSPEVFGLADHFKNVNHDVISQRNVIKVTDDGRSFLSHSGKKFDIITSNAVHPRLSSGLYTEEFYKLCRMKLTSGGVFCQWIPTNWLTLSEFKSLIRSFTNVFSHCSLWFITRSHTLLMATPDPVDLTEERFQSLFNDDHLAESLQETDLTNPSALASLFLIQDHDLRNMTKDAMNNTDNLPLIEYSRAVMMKPNPEILKNMLENISPVSALVRNDNLNREQQELWMKGVHFQREQIIQQIILYLETFRTETSK